MDDLLYSIFDQGGRGPYEANRLAKMFNEVVSGSSLEKASASASKFLRYIDEDTYENTQLYNWRTVDGGENLLMPTVDSVASEQALTDFVATNGDLASLTETLQEAQTELVAAQTKVDAAEVETSRARETVRTAKTTLLMYEGFTEDVVVSGAPGPEPEVAAFPEGERPEEIE